MEVSFAKNDNVPVTPAEQVAPAAVPSPASDPAPQQQAVAQRPANTSLTAGGLLGDYIPEFKEIILPRLNIAQNIGEVGKAFPLGALVFDQKVPIFIPPLFNPATQKLDREGTPPATVIVVGFKPTRFSEKVEGGGRGIIVGTEDAVRAAGGTLDYSEYQLKKASGMKRFEPLADAMVAVKRLADCKDESIFTYDAEGGKWALAMWAMKGTAYTSAAKRVFFTARRTSYLREGGYPSWTFAISTRMESYPGGHSAWVPVCLPVAKTSDAMLAFIKSVLSAPSVD